MIGMKYRHLAVGLVCSAVALNLGSALASGHGHSHAKTTKAERAAKAAEEALTLTPDKENGKEIYKICTVCHTPEGWGTNSGYYPQIAGQHQKVIIKQLGDIGARNRDNPTMLPFSIPDSLGGAQGMADVAAYIADLPMTPSNGKGPGFDLDMGERLYKQECAECHGDQGEGKPGDEIPLIQGQHYNYLMRQFNWIKNGKRRNADQKMVKQVQRFSGRDISAMMDYTSRLSPPKEKVAENGWRNPDFPKYSRHSMPRQMHDRPERPKRPERPGWAR
ncbi:MAG: c-type cytochrome [Sedimenticola sp.]